MLTFKSRYEILQWLPKHSIGMEIGVLTGDFSRHMVNIIQPKHLVLVDPWRLDAPGQINFSTTNVPQEIHDKRYKATIAKFAEGIKKGQIQVFRCASREIVNQVPDLYFDWIYIDGDHSEQGCSIDLELSKQKIKEDGYIILDDYMRNKTYGVIQAVDKFLKQYGEFHQMGETQSGNKNIILQRRLR